MALADGNGNEMIMPVAPMYGGNGGFGANGLGGDWAWIILLLLLAGVIMDSAEMAEMVFIRG